MMKHFLFTEPRDYISGAESTKLENWKIFTQNVLYAEKSSYVSGNSQKILMYTFMIVLAETHWL